MLWIALGLYWGLGVTWFGMWRKTRRIAARMRAYWDNESSYAQVVGLRQQLLRLFQLARISDVRIGVSSPGAWSSISVFDHLFQPSTRNAVSGFLVEAESFFGHQMRRCFVPVFWPSVLLTFPEDVAVYFGADPKKSRTVVAKAVWALTVSTSSAALYVLRRRLF